MNLDETTRALCAELSERQHCHTVILYGSRAHGTTLPESDYDLAGFREAETTVRDARVCQGRFLDLFLYPDSLLAAPTANLLKLRGGVVLTERDGLGTALLARLEEIFTAGPEKLPPDEIEARRVWAFKMLARAKRGDLEGNYRRSWLLTALIEDYFHLRGLWYLGSKAAFAWLREHDARTCAACEEALKPGARIEAIAALVALVTERAEPDGPDELRD